MASESVINSPDKALIGASGEHLVLSRLLGRGLLAAQAPRGARKADILVNFIDGGEPFLVQVKTSDKGGGWAMNVKHESITDADLFYCFVDIKPAAAYVGWLDQAVVVNQVPAASGARYQGENYAGKFELWDHGKEMTFTMPGGKPMTCAPEETG